MNIQSMKWLGAASIAVALMACGGGYDPVLVATANLMVAPSPANGAGAALVGRTFSFPEGVTAMGTTAATSMAVSGTAAAQSATVLSAGQMASGPLTYGSCILTVTTSTFPATSPLALGQVLTIHPCNLAVVTEGAVANGGSSLRYANLALGTSISANLLIPVTLNTDGSVVVGGVILGTVATTPATGN